MPKNLIRGRARALLAILALAASVVSPAGAADPPLVVGFVYVTPIGEAGWTYQHELGRRALERALGPRVKTLARRGGRRRAGLGAGDARPGRGARRQAGLRHQLRLPRAGAARRRRVPGGQVRARRRLQERAQPRHLRRPLLRGALAGRLARRAGEPERRRRLRRRLSGARGGAGHQRLHPRHARRPGERAGAGALARTPGSTRHASATPPRP